MTENPDWERAGFTDDDGRLALTELPSGFALVPNKISLNAGWLTWPLSGSYSFGESKADLNSFLALRESTDADILRFAEKYGPLGLCPHRFPCSENSSAPRFNVWCCRASGSGPFEFAGEPLCVWRSFARELGALLSISARLKQRLPGKPEDWKFLCTGQAPLPLGRINNESRLVAARISYLLGLSGIRNAYSWSRNGSFYAEPRASAGLCGHFLLELGSVIAATSDPGVVRCSICQSEYPPKRKPRAGERHFCHDCVRAGLPARMAAKDYRSRRKREPMVDIAASSLPVLPAAENLIAAYLQHMDAASVIVLFEKLTKHVQQWQMPEEPRRIAVG